MIYIVFMTCGTGNHNSPKLAPLFYAALSKHCHKNNHNYCKMACKAASQIYCKLYINFTQSRKKQKTVQGLQCTLPGT